MADDVRRWSEELAHDPASLVFLPLAETLRRQGELDVARKVALRGLQRHPHNAEAHDLLARIHADSGHLQDAFDEWDVVLRLAPGHPGALKGQAFVRFQQGAHDDAERLLEQARAAGDDPDLAAAIETVRRSSGRVAMVTDPVLDPLPADPRDLFAPLLAPDQAAMLLSRDGLVLAGVYRLADGRDVAQDIGASLSGVSDEAYRTTRHLDVGAWRSIIFETEGAVVSLSPAEGGETLQGGLLVVAGAPTMPLGLLRRLLDRCLARVTAWVRAGGGGPAQ